jgi:hypothetical protein
VYDRSKARKRKESGNGQQGADPFGAVIMDQDKIVYTPRPAPRNERVDPKPWGQPYEADVREFDPPQARWEGLYQDAVLRLEKTSANKAIVYPFEDFTTADAAREGVLRRSNRRLGKHAVLCGIRSDPPRMFVRRGSAWGKRLDPELAALNRDIEKG